MMNNRFLFKVLMVCVSSIGASSMYAVQFGFRQIDSNPVGCAGNDGSIVIQVNSNPNRPILYSVREENSPQPQIQLDNGTFTGLSAGSYTVSAEDRTTGESVTGLITVSPLIPLSITTTLIGHVSQRGRNDGFISVAVRGGKGERTYFLNGVPSSSPNFNNLPAGDYNVTVRSADFTQEGCNVDFVLVSIVQP